ncbi:hypothetical protein K1719_011105 [Acacia pycnantha]|nr:hypothetical protein K1719_011105 [Acacia pycnantha]
MVSSHKSISFLRTNDISQSAPRATGEVHIIVGQCLLARLLLCSVVSSLRLTVAGSQMAAECARNALFSPRTGN